MGRMASAPVKRRARPIRMCVIGAYDPAHSRVNSTLMSAKGAGIEVVHCRMPRGRFVFLPFVYLGIFCKALLMRKDYDLYFAPETSQFVFPIIWLISRLWPRPILFDPFISIFDDAVEYQKLIRNALLKRLYHWLDEFSMKKSDLIMADAMQHGAFWAKKYGFPKKKIRFFPLGADESAFRKKAVQRRWTGRGKITVLFYGTYIVGHGTEVILHAADRLRKRKDIEFLMVGEGETLAETIALSKRLKLDNVVFKPKQPRETINDMINESDILLGLLADSHRIQMVIPTKVFEAAAVGKSILTAFSPAVADFFADGKDILYVKPGDAADLSEKILLVAKDKRLRDRLSRNSARIFKTQFSLRKRSGFFKEYCDELLGAQASSKRSG